MSTPNARSWRGAPLFAAGAFGLAFSLTGCVSFACPAVGWTNALTVVLDGDTAAVEQVQLCTEDGCAPAEDADMTGPLGWVAVEERTEHSWTFSVDALPDTFTVRALGTGEAVLSDTEVTPSWTRVGGSAQCGGPSEATVTVTL